jgi:predicted DNA-binding transcriptional regulator YafY
MKLERLLAIIMLLLNRKQINAKELAEYFEVSQRTIYRDIDAINQAGIPIVSYMGAEGGFGILENYKINKNFLDDYEINSLITALKNLNNTVNNRKISLTLEKLESMKPRKDINSNNSNVIPINIDYNNWNSNNTDKEKLKALNKAIYEKRIICFDYVNTKGEYTHRVVEPLSLLLKDFSWYLQGYCHSKEDYRLFKVKRMRMVNITEDFFTREAPPLEALDYSEEWYKDKTVIDITLKFKVEARTRVVDSFNEEQIQFYEDGTTRVNFTAPEDNWLFELILGFGSQVEVVKPPQLRLLIRQKAFEISNIYKNDK